MGALCTKAWGEGQLGSITLFSDSEIEPYPGTIRVIGVENVQDREERMWQASQLVCELTQNANPLRDAYSL
jgi:hypothetical protein